MIREVLFDLLAERHLRHAIRRLRFLEGKLPDAAVRFAVPFVFRGRGHFKSMRAVQMPREILALYRLVCERRPRRIVEIGTASGGTLYLWTQAAADDAVIVSVDLPGGRFGGGYLECRRAFYQAFARAAQRLHCLRCDSHDPETVRRVAALIEGEPVDYLFIDADHTYRGVRRNLELYGPLVRPQGWIVFHDILPNPRDPDIQVFRLWSELRDVGDVMEWVFPDEWGNCPGIGLLRVPDGGAADLVKSLGARDLDRAG